MIFLNMFLITILKNLPFIIVLVLSAKYTSPARSCTNLSTSVERLMEKVIIVKQRISVGSSIVNNSAARNLVCDRPVNKLLPKLHHIKN